MTKTVRVIRAMSSWVSVICGKMLNLDLLKSLQVGLKDEFDEFIPQQEGAEMNVPHGRNTSHPLPETDEKFPQLLQCEFLFLGLPVDKRSCKCPILRPRDFTRQLILAHWPPPSNSKYLRCCAIHKSSETWQGFEVWTLSIVSKGFPIENDFKNG